MYNVCLVEDEKDLATLVMKYLVKEGYNVKHYLTGEEALQNFSSEVDLWILDIMLPGQISGYDLIKEIRTRKEGVPIIFTSARDQDIDKIMGLELGGDDYLPKPYSPRELMLRIKNILTRTYKNISSPIINYENYKIDLDKRIVHDENEALNLTSKEYDLMLFLLKNPTKAFSRDQILTNIWGEQYFGSDRVVDDLMRRLRAKMPNLRVETLYGFGYRLS
ncbi:MAG: response regulator transcription factor [bacterium]